MLQNGSIYYNNVNIDYYQSDLTQAVLTSANLTNERIRLPYTPLPGLNCVLISPDQVASFLE